MQIFQAKLKGHTAANSQQQQPKELLSLKMSNRLVECYDQKLIAQVPSIFKMTTANTQQRPNSYARSVKVATTPATATMYAVRVCSKLEEKKS